MPCTRTIWARRNRTRAMRGIVGVLGPRPVSRDILSALKRLERRGYDSAGAATLEGGRLTRLRAEDELKNLEARLRTASRAKPTRARARVAVVHTGVIENFKALREELDAKDHRFATETDSEVAAFLVEDELEKGLKPAEAIAAAAAAGSFCFGNRSEARPPLMRLGRDRSRGRVRRSPRERRSARGATSSARRPSSVRISRNCPLTRPPRRRRRSAIA